MPSSFLLNLRRKDRSPTSPTQGPAAAIEIPSPPRSSNNSPAPSRNVFKRRPSDTPSESSGRFRRFFKSSYAETDTSSLASVDEPAQVETSPHSSPFHFPPRSPPSSNDSSLSSPRSPNRPLPPLPPVRPPRPPSLNLDGVPLTPTHPTLKGIRRPPQRPLIPDQFNPRPGHKMPELDNVWEGFIRDAEGEDMDEFTIPPRRHGLSKDRRCVSNTFLNRSHKGVQAMLDPSSTRRPRPSLYRAGGSESTPYLPSPPELTSDSDSEYSNDELSRGDAPFSLALFPAPPPMRRRAIPKPLVLLPTPSIAPLPPSPCFSSGDSTPVATPTTPRFAEPSPCSARKGILKKPPATLSPFTLDPTPPPTPLTPTYIRTLSAESPTAFPHSLRSAKSVPHLQTPLILTASNVHRNTSSDTTSGGDRRRVLSRPDPHTRHPHPKTPSSAPPPANVQWGYAV